MNVLWFVSTVTTRKGVGKLLCAEYQGSNARIAPDSPEEDDFNDDDGRNVAKSDKVSQTLPSAIEVFLFWFISKEKEALKYPSLMNNRK